MGYWLVMIWRPSSLDIVAFDKAIEHNASASAEAPGAPGLRPVFRLFRRCRLANLPPLPPVPEASRRSCWLVRCGPSAEVTPGPASGCWCPTRWPFWELGVSRCTYIYLLFCWLFCPLHPRDSLLQFCILTSRPTSWTTRSPPNITSWRRYRSWQPMTSRKLSRSRSPLIPCLPGRRSSPTRGS